MSLECRSIHQLVKTLKRHHFPFDESLIPMNGIYLLFEKGETKHQQERIVRIGTHTGNNKLRSRIKEHFLKENKDRSIFRKNIGRALLNQNKDSFLKFWELDLTTKKMREKYASLIDGDYQEKIEKQVSQYIKRNFTFSVFEVNNKEERLQIEKKIIAIVSLCEECRPSEKWLGKASPKEKIVESGLWLVQGLYKEPFNQTGVERLSKLIKR